MDQQRVSVTEAYHTRDSMHAQTSTNLSPSPHAILEAMWAVVVVVVQP